MLSFVKLLLITRFFCYAVIIVDVVLQPDPSELPDYLPFLKQAEKDAHRNQIPPLSLRALLKMVNIL